MPAIAFSLLLLVSAFAGQDAPKRLELKAGGPAVIVKGEVIKGKDVVYVFAAKAGQKFSGRITRKDGNTGFEVSDPDGQGLPEEEYDFNTGLNGTLPKTGDYKVIVSTFETRASQYTISLKVF